jgi:hypothetical protein
MDSYLKGRPKTQRFHAAIPAQKSGAKTAQEKKQDQADESIVRAQAEPGVVNSPDVDLVVRGGAVRRIVIHMPGGNRLELDCEYEDEAGI